MRWIVTMAVLAWVAATSLGCSGKPKYPACGGDKDCREGERCINQKCLQCGEDSDCPEGQTCVDGACAVKTVEKKPDDGLKSCNVDEDCDDDEDCIEGKCRKPWDNDAPDGLSCQLESIHFGFDQAQLAEEERATLERTATCIKEAPTDRGVYIEGHTDPRGTEEYNIALSERRARGVADYLANLGIDPVRFQVIPKGEAEATGVDETSWNQDRRVDFEWK